MSNAATYFDDASEPAFMQDAIAEIAKLHDLVAGWWPTAHAAIRAAEAARCEQISWKIQCSYSRSALFGILIVANDVTDLNMVAPLLRALRKEGYRVKTHEDWSDLPSRTYYMECLNDHEPKGPIVVRVIFPWDAEKAAAATCKFVQVGTKEVPVMKIVCGGEEAPELVGEVTA